jgi:hypothetical protein
MSNDRLFASFFFAEKSKALCKGKSSSKQLPWD